jgi:hypothetical protein
MEFEQEFTGDDVADLAFQAAEIAEIGRDAIAHPADHGGGDHHPERRHPAGPAREAARLALRVQPVPQLIIAADNDVDGTLLEKILHRHGFTPRGKAAPYRETA